MKVLEILTQSLLPSAVVCVVSAWTLAMCLCVYERVTWTIKVSSGSSAESSAEHPQGEAS